MKPLNIAPFANDANAEYQRRRTTKHNHKKENARAILFCVGILVLVLIVGWAEGSL